ncbi:MAG: hypothetical protein ACI9FB_003924, partial [Candidatus Azotimanducaceae bacterium]
MKISRLTFALTILTTMIVGCGGNDEALEAVEIIDNTQEVQDYYAAKPEFFSFKTLADLPED